MVRLLLKYEPCLDTTLRIRRDNCIQDCFAYARTKNFLEIAELLLLKGAAVTRPLSPSGREYKYRKKAYNKMNEIVAKYEKLRKIRNLLAMDSNYIRSGYYPEAFRRLNKNVKLTVFKNFIK